MLSPSSSSSSHRCWGYVQLCAPNPQQSMVVLPPPLAQYLNLLLPLIFLEKVHHTLFSVIQAVRAASSSHINAASLTRLTVLILFFHNQSVISSIIIVVHLRRKPNGFPLRLALKLTVNTRSKLPAWKFHQSVGVCNSFHRGNRVILPRGAILFKIVWGTKEN